MMTWLTPAMIVGMARGSWIPLRISQSVAPKERPASTVSLSTCLIPSSVIRTPGGMEKMSVANRPGTAPIEKNSTAGMR